MPLFMMEKYPSTVLVEIVRPVFVTSVFFLAVIDGAVFPAVLAELHPGRGIRHDVGAAQSPADSCRQSKCHRPPQFPRACLPLALGPEPNEYDEP